MKAITVRQPWAGLIMSGIKTIENRSWHTPYRGKLIIHAGAQADKEGLRWCAEQGIALPPICSVRGAALGIIDLAAIIIADEAKNIYWTDPADAGRLKIRPNLFWFNWEGFGWILQAPEMFPSPIPAAGKLGLWEFPL